MRSARREGAALRQERRTHLNDQISATTSGASAASPKVTLGVLAFGDRGGYRRPVGGVEIRAFAQDHLDAAGSLLAARHREHRAAEPLLSVGFEDAAATRGEVASLWAQEHTSGAVALRAGKVVGFLLGTRKDDQAWGANVWVEAAGYAAEEPELARDLYAFSSQRWVEEGRTRHYALVPNLESHVGAWFRLGFGAQHAHGITEVDQRVWPPPGGGAQSSATSKQ